jgi:transposase
MLTEPADPALPDDVATLQSLVAGLSAQVAGLSVQLNARDRIIEVLKAQLAALRRRHFGPQSERLGRLADQLELQIEEMEQSQVPAAAEVSEEPPQAARERPVRKPLPASLPGEEEILAPPYARCPSCGVALHRIGEDVSEVLEVVPARLRVRRYIRPVMTCRCCGDVSQAAPPPLPLAKSNAGASLLADIALAKYDDHLPTYRQAERFAREGLDLPRSTLTDWLGRTAVLLKPLIEAIAAHVFQADKLHADDTPVSVLAPGAGKTRTGRLWVPRRPRQRRRHGAGRAVPLLARPQGRPSPEPFGGLARQLAGRWLCRLLRSLQRLGDRPGRDRGDCLLGSYPAQVL